MLSNLTNAKESWSLAFLKLKCRWGNRIIQLSCKIDFTLEIRFPDFHLKKFQKYDNSIVETCRMLSNLMNEQELASFIVLKLKYRWRDRIIQPLCRSGSLEEIRSPLFNLRIFQKSEKSTGEASRMY